MDEYLIIVNKPSFVSVGGNYFYAKKAFVNGDKTYYDVIGGCDDTHIWVDNKDYGAINLIIVDKDGNGAGAIKEAKRYIRLGRAKVTNRYLRNYLVLA